MYHRSLAWLVTFRLMDEAGTRHSYVIKDAPDAFTARLWAQRLASGPAELAARRHVDIDPGYDDVLAITEDVLATTLRFTHGRL
ncbi:hypothetical protein [Streptomyces sp. NPDC058671]|uniref:hypothetical protein n=1 Tax=Streptomyces sp. NPDC058671 TaxID=3346590 RepID=UPI0036541C24